jgi:hypothetical protein
MLGRKAPVVNCFDVAAGKTKGPGGTGAFDDREYA